jgi:hypothetical protein
VKNMLLKAVLLGGLILLFTIGAQAQSTPWACFFAGTASYNGIPAPVGTVIDAYDPDGIHCGSWIVNAAGFFGAMAVVGDDTTDPNDPTDEGAVDGDTITFYINGLKADCVGDCTWTDKATKEIELSVVEDSVIIDFQIVVSPGPRAVRPGETITVKVGVQNLGNALDLYGITAYTDKGWTTIPQDSASHAEPGDTTFVYFKVEINIWPGEPPTDVIHYTVFSYNDPSVTASGTVNLTVSVTDVDDPLVILPGSFELFQNYPNPFNPTTIIGFNLASLSHVNLQIYDITGRLVGEKDLGMLSSGNHEIEYNAAGLASGVYLYRLATETSSQTRKMILVK